MNVFRLFLAFLLLTAPPAAAALDLAAAARALERETNRVRVRAGLHPLQLSAECRTAAQWQVEYLVRANRLSHTQPTARLRDVGARLEAAGARPRFAAENAASNFNLNYVPGKLFYPRPGPGGRGLIASYTPNGRPLEPHSPETFAAAVVGQWLHSRGHRRNLLAPEATHLACAVASATPRNEDVAPLGRIFAVQVLAAVAPAGTDPLGRTVVGGRPVRRE